MISWSRYEERGIKATRILAEMLFQQSHKAYHFAHTTSHRGRIGSIVSVLYSVFFSLTQYAISLILLVAGGNYRLLWTIIISCGLLALDMYALAYPLDRRRFPELYR